ncbi:hypothetical protein QBZ16_000793 [Prototheca wickerhamii]|uniref:Uncharacterized protein n=1 Tax=Prototheca wickerhamii TaxID=3111 RepID=A0AAD9MJ11_PROWI|nr:hypothetical protein QBZ16_000793 [Prototheca wickerhamii]
MAALLAAGTSSTMGLPRSATPPEDPPAKRLRRTPEPDRFSTPGRSAGACTPDPIGVLPPGCLYPAPVDLLSQVGPAVVESGYTHAVVSLELLRMLDWRARRSFVAERDAQRAAGRRSCEGGPLLSHPSESGSAAEFIARVSQRIPSLASQPYSGSSAGLSLTTASSSPSSTTLLSQLQTLAGISSPIGGGHARRGPPARRLHAPAPAPRREPAAPPLAAIDALASLLSRAQEAPAQAPRPAPPAPSALPPESDAVVSALASMLSALVQQQPRRGASPPEGRHSRQASE